MAKNAKANKEVVEQHPGGVQPVQEGSGSDNNQTATPGATEGGAEELQVSTEQGSSEQTNDQGNTEMDSTDQGKPTGKEGDDTGSGTEDEESEVYAEAKEVIKGMVKESLAELNEPTEKTEKRNKIASEVFEKNSTKSALHFTSDLIPFFEKSDALRHAATLNDDTVVTINKQ